VDLVGFEPTTSSMPFLQTILERMRRNECKLHSRNKLAHFSPSATGTDKHPFAPTCTGMDEGVMSQLTSQNPAAYPSTIFPREV
jgi:hypothetical protein